MVDRMDQNQEIVSRYLNDPQFHDLAFRLLVKRIYDEIRGAKERGSRLMSPHALAIPREKSVTHVEGAPLTAEARP